jgi:hypothetical protein
MMELDEDQHKRAEVLVREKKERCLNCGSSDLWCGYVARIVQGGFVLDLWCQNEGAHPQGASSLHRFRVTNQEAWFIGL